MDLTKLISILATRQLYLTRVDQFDDNFEGSFPAPRPGGFQGFFAKQDAERYQKSKSKSDLERKAFYASCWNCLEGESNAMWNLYGQNGVAIRTTVHRLRNSLQAASQKLFTVNVVYNENWIWMNCPDDPIFYACVTKRRPFAHEQEIRVMWIDEESRRTSRVGHVGINAACDIEKLIEAIYLGPTVGQWFAPIMEEMLKKYGVTAPVVHSCLSGKPDRGD